MKYRNIIDAWSKFWNPQSAIRIPCSAIVLLLLLPALVFAQSKKDLEDKRKKLLRDIQVTDKLLKKTTQTREAAYDRFLALQNQIQQRENLIETLDEEVAAADVEIERNNSVVTSLARDVQQMKAEYGSTVRSAFRRKVLSNPLMYILSAESLNQAFRRWLFLRKYDRMRKKQAEAIVFTWRMLRKKVSTLEEKRREKAELLASLQDQKVSLFTELSDKDKLIKTLSKDESRLRDELKQKEAAHEALNRAIESVIQEEVRKRTEESRKPAAPTSSQPIASNTPSSAKNNTRAAAPAATALSADDKLTLDFRKNRGKLPWPVESGFIARGFGRQKHPTIKNIEVTNNGVDIRTDESAAVRAIFDGRVAGVQFIPGHDYTVIVQHGDYYTVYSNLASTSLTKDQAVSAKQVIGNVSNNPITGATEIHFELWYQKERLNPALWIKK